MNAEELIAKVKALAEEGVAGEKENAKLLLDKLCKKHNIRLEDIDDERVDFFDISWTSQYERRLFNQVFYSVVGNLDNEKGFYTYRHRRNKGSLKCTKAEFLETQAKFNFYKYHLEKDMKLFYDAFVEQNDIYPTKDKIKPIENRATLTEEQLRVLRLSKSLERHNYNLQIEGGNKQ